MSNKRKKIDWKVLELYPIIWYKTAQLYSKGNQYVAQKSVLFLVMPTYRKLYNRRLFQIKDCLE